MEGKALIAFQRHAGTCAVQRTGPGHLGEKIKFSAGSVRYLLSVFVIVTFVTACNGLFPGQALAAGAFAAPALKNIAQMPFDDETRRLVYPNSLGYDAVYDEIYLVNGGSLRVVVYGPDFFPRVSIGAGRGVVSPSGVTIAPNGEVYVTQVRTKLNPYPRITILNAAFFVDREIFFDEIPEAEGFIPKRIALSRDGLIYVSGENTRGVMVLDSEGTFLRWMQPVDQVYSRNVLEEDENPSGVKEQPIVSVQDSPTDAEPEAVQPAEEDPYADIPEEFRPRTNIPGVGSGAAKVESPVLINFVTIDSAGKIYLLSNETGKVYVYGPDEDLLFSFGTKGGSPGQLSQPRAVAIDEQNELIYVADYMRHTILIYDQEGEYLFEVGGRGTEPGFFNFPNAMLMNKHGQFVIADLFNGRVQVLELGYDDWLNRFETGEESEALQDQGGIETPSVEAEISSPSSEGLLVTPSQEVLSSDPQDVDLDGMARGTEPEIAPESIEQEESPGQSEDVIEVILPEDAIPAFQEDKGK
jgi:DNA-binding beta-propeller fold protein YncE